MTRSASDALSLTLPGRAKVRARWKRPRRPSPWELWYLCWTTLSIIWSGYQRARKGHQFPLDLFAVAWICGLGTALIIAGVPG